MAAGGGGIGDLAMTHTSSMAERAVPMTMMVERLSPPWLVCSDVMDFSYRFLTC